MLPESMLLLSVALLGSPREPADGAVIEVHVAKVGDRFLKVDDAPAEPAVADADADADGLVARPPGPPRRAPKVRLARENFDEIVFKGAWIPRVRRPHLDYVLDYRIGRVGEKRPLTEAERHQLHLAGTGDIQRYLNRVEAARTDFEAARVDFKSGIAELDRLESLGREFRQGPFGAGSLYAKALNQIEKGGR